MLIEKAYAKLYGCFEVLNSGSTEAALSDLLGGTVETTKLHSKAVSERAERGTSGFAEATRHADRIAARLQQDVLRLELVTCSL